MKKLRVLNLLVLLGCLFLLLDVQTVEANYTYDYWQQPIPSKNGFQVRDNGIVYGRSIDFTVEEDEEMVSMRHATDIFVTDDYYYIVDREISRVVKLNKQFETIHVFTGAEVETDEGVVFEAFDSPRGIFVTSDHEHYITDYNNRAIYVFDADYAFVRKIERPDNPTYGERPFQVNKIVLDRTKRIYVTIGNVYDGTVELTNNGEFSRFYGVQEVSVNPIDLVWRRLMTDAQLSRAVLFLPVEYTNMAIDNEGFIYATATSDSNTPIQRLNPNGNDVLRRNGYVPPAGDVIKHPNQNQASFVSIDVNDYGVYSVLDRANRRVFTYNDEGYLIYVTGGEGDVEGRFRTPTTLAYDGEYMLVGDSTLNTITIFEPSAFGQKVNEALRLTYFGEYLDIAQLWYDIIAENANFSYAYIGIANDLYRQGRFKEAMEMYELGFDREGFSKAYDQHRKEVLRSNFGFIGVGAMVLVGLTIVRPIVLDIKRGETE